MIDGDYIGACFFGWSHESGYTTIYSHPPSVLLEWGLACRHGNRRALDDAGQKYLGRT